MLVTETELSLLGSSFLKNVKSFHAWKQEQQMVVPKEGSEGSEKEPIRFAYC